jgi:hypothetical protein
MHALRVRNEEHEERSARQQAADAEEARRPIKRDQAEPAPMGHPMQYHERRKGLPLIMNQPDLPREGTDCYDYSHHVYAFDSGPTVTTMLSILCLLLLLLLLIDLGPLVSFLCLVCRSR